MATTVAIIVMLVLFLFNVPIFVSVIASVLTYFGLSNEMSLMIVAQRIIGGIESIPLLAVPFFVMAGVVMNYTGITKRMVTFAEVLTGHLPGGLAQVNVLLSTLMGGLSGSNIADAAMQSKILVPEMVDRGYDKDFSAAVTGASSLITPIIPPGIGLIIYGFIANVSIGKLFLAGIVPGVMTCVLMMVVVHIVSKKRGYAPTRQKFASFKEIFLATKDAFFALILPLVIIGGIRFGIFTPTEAGAIAVAFSLVLGLIVYREMKISQLKDVMIETTTTTAAIMLIIGAASALAWFLTWERIPQIATSYVLSIVSTRGMFLLLLNVFLLFVGMFIEGNAAMIVLIPLLMPMINTLGIDPVHFGLVFIFNMAVGTLTPPMGTVMFTVSSITGVKINDFVKASWPFYALLFACLLIITYIPAISLFLPNLLMK